MNRYTPALKIDVITDSSRWEHSSTDYKRIAEGTILESWAYLRKQTKDLPETAALTVLLTDDETIRTLNRKYRGKNKETNVLSFPDKGADDEEFIFDEASQYLGDIAISFETVVEEARDQNKTIINHLRHLALHGFLHLMGYDHESETEASEMEDLEIRILARLGVENPYTDTNSMA